MRRRREEHDAAHRRRHLRGKVAHERKRRGLTASVRAPLADDDDADEAWFDLAEAPATHHVSVRKGAAGNPALL
jgi:hypothetical protein